jgi:hypothetical protein
VNITRARTPSSQAAANGASRGRFAAELTRFSRHKQKLLDALVEGHRRGPKFSAFDKDKSWDDLLHLARFYFSGEEAKKKEKSAATYVKQLTEFADHIGKARGLVPAGAYGGGIGSYIFWMWSQEARKRGLSPTVADFDRFFAILPQLEMAARKAADRECKPGRPRGRSILPSSEVLIGLAAAYRRCTGSKPGAGGGPFARFAMKCLIALGRSGLKEGPLKDAIKVARQQAIIFASRKSAPSPFA